MLQLLSRQTKWLIILTILSYMVGLILCIDDFDISNSSFTYKYIGNIKQDHCKKNLNYTSQTCNRFKNNDCYEVYIKINYTNHENNLTCSLLTYDNKTNVNSKLNINYLKNSTHDIFISKDDDTCYNSPPIYPDRIINYLGFMFLAYGFILLLFSIKLLILDYKNKYKTIPYNKITLETYGSHKFLESQIPYHYISYNEELKTKKIQERINKLDEIKDIPTVEAYPINNNSPKKETIIHKNYIIINNTQNGLNYRFTDFQQMDNNYENV